MPGIPSFVACRPGGPHIQQRDWLNLLAAFAAAKQCGVEVRRFARISSHLTTSICIYIYICIYICIHISSASPLHNTLLAPNTTCRSEDY